MLNKFIYMLPFLAGFNGVTINLGGYNARLDQIASVLMAIVLVFKTVSGRQKIVKDKSTIILLLFLLYAIIASLSFAPDEKYSFMQTLSFISVAIIFVLISNIITTNEQLNKFTKYFIFSGIIHCTIGVLFFILSILGLMNYGANLLDDLTTPYGAYGTMVEPNIYGGYCLGYFIFSLTLALTTKTLKRYIIILLSTSFLGLFLSFTRGAWIAANIGLLLVLFYVMKIKKIQFKRFGFLFVLMVVMCIIVITSASNYFLVYKISNLFDADSGTGLYRIAVWGKAIENFIDHPFFGTGTYSFATIMGDGTYDPLTSPWIGNLYITLLHDYGIIGFFIFGLFFISLVFKSLRIVSKKYENIESEDKLLLMALCLSVISLYIAFFFTTGLSLSYSWIFMGMIALYKRKYEVEFRP